MIRIVLGRRRGSLPRRQLRNGHTRTRAAVTVFAAAQAAQKVKHARMQAVITFAAAQAAQKNRARTGQVR